MRKLLFTLFIVLCNQILFAQDTTSKYSFEFKEINRATAIQTIESSTSFKFYFDPEWLESDKKLITVSFTNASIENILDQLFNNTPLNFYVLKNKIILTKNSAIHDKLASNYFAPSGLNNANGEANETIEKPIYQQQYDSISDSNSKKNYAIAFIGKETKQTDNKFCIISGYIKNAETEKPEANIVVKVRNKNISTISDNEGFYTLQVPTGINIIETKSLNHKKSSRTIMAYNNGEFNMNITESSNQLNEVIVKNKGTRKVETVVSGLVSIDIETMKNVPLVLGERDLLKVATTFPGIKTTGEGSAGFNVRGGKEDQNLILLDNAVLYNPQHFLGFFSAINPYTTKKANIYKGSMPSEFGGRLSSVFDITTKNSSLDKISGEGGIGIITTNLSVGIPIEKDKSGILVGGRATYSDWVLNSLDNENLKNSNAGFYDGIIRYNNTLNKNNALESTLYYSHDDFSISSDSLYNYSNRLATLKWDHSFNKKNKAALILTNSEYKFNIDYDTEDINAFDFGYKINETQLALKFNYLHSEKHKFTYGFTSKLYNIDPGHLDPKKPEATIIPVNIDDEKGLESALYLSDSFKINEKLLLDLGLRYSLYASLGPSTQRIYGEGLPINDDTVTGTNTYENNEVAKTYGGLEPRIAARYFMAEDFSIKAGYDKTRQYIHLLSSNVTQTPLDAWTLSNTNVKPQTAEQYSLGLFKNLDNDILELSLEGYYKRSHNIFDYKVGAQLILNENIETELLQGEGKAYGIEFLIKKQIGRLNGWLGYTYSRSFIKLDSQFNEEKINNGEFFPTNFDKPHDITAVLNYKFTKRYSLSTNFVYQTGRPITFPIGTYNYNNADYTLYSDRNQYRIPDYYRLDIGFNIEGNHKIKKLAHSFWNVSVYNLLGRNNPYSVYFITGSDGKIKGYKTSIFAYPIPSISYNFKF